MNKKDLLIVGKKSFIGSGVYRILKNKKKINIMTFENFMKLNQKSISKFRYICNCSVNKNNIFKTYDFKFDYDLKIANKIKNLDIIFIFLSSRKVYKPMYNIKETQKLKPIDIYSRNKIKIEKLLKKKLSSKLLILRISNVIGLKKFKNSRRAHKTFFDNYLDMCNGNKNFKFYNVYKDFISIDQLSKIFSLIFQKKLRGIYNVSLGRKISLKEIISWLDKFNSQNKIFFHKKGNIKQIRKKSFYLNNMKLTKKIKYKPQKKDLKRFCLQLSKAIH